MNVLVLTNPEYKGFVAQTLFDNKLTPDDVFVDWFGNKFIFEEPLTSWYDIGISFMYTHKVPAEQVNTHTWFNFHPAPLPEYKGRNLCYHAIMNGEKEFGATLHYMDENFDTGDIIEVSRFGLTHYSTAGDVSLLAIEHSKDLFKKYLPRILAGEQFNCIPNVGGTYYKKESIEDFIGLNDYQDKRVRAITYGDFYPKIDVGGIIYKVVRE